MRDLPVIRSLKLQNLLSFAGDADPIELQSLNVLVGPNGSGKSNLIEAIGLLHSLPNDLNAAISNGGGIAEWIWKGQHRGGAAFLEVQAEWRESVFSYGLQIGNDNFRLTLEDEHLQEEKPGKKRSRPFVHVEHPGRPVLRRKAGTRNGSGADLDEQRSIFAQLKDPNHYPEITAFGELFSTIRLYRDWEFGALARVREPSEASLQRIYLEEDGSNFANVLDKLLSLPAIKRQLIENLRLFNPEATDLRTSVLGSRIQVLLEEGGLASGIPLIRMSDGTLRWLALLAILLNPDASSLVCIEEPELGLHPDAVHEVGKLLLAASERTQLVVTTHSAVLIDELESKPEAVIVCEKENGRSLLRRLDRDRLKGWLHDYSLGQLWRRGHIGGNRW